MSLTTFLLTIDSTNPSTSQSRIYSHLVLFGQSAVWGYCLYWRLWTALVVYDHFLTLHREIHSVWLQKRTKGSTIFLVNRYALLSLVVGLLVKDHSRVTTQVSTLADRIASVCWFHVRIEVRNDLMIAYHRSSIYRAALLAVSYINVFITCLFFSYAYVPAVSVDTELCF